MAIFCWTFKTLSTFSHPTVKWYSLWCRVQMSQGREWNLWFSDAPKLRKRTFLVIVDMHCNKICYTPLSRPCILIIFTSFTGNDAKSAYAATTTDSWKSPLISRHCDISSSGNDYSGRPLPWTVKRHNKPHQAGKLRQRCWWVILPFIVRWFWKVESIIFFVSSPITHCRLVISLW